jgi:hypothetical protein
VCVCVCRLCDTGRPGVVAPTLRMRSTAVSYGCIAIKPTRRKEMSISEPAARHSLWITLRSDGKIQTTLWETKSRSVWYDER